MATCNAQRRQGQRSDARPPQDYRTIPQYDTSYQTSNEIEGVKGKKPTDDNQAEMKPWLPCLTEAGSIPIIKALLCPRSCHHPLYISLFNVKLMGLTRTKKRNFYFTENIKSGFGSFRAYALQLILLKSDTMHGIRYHRISWSLILIITHVQLSTKFNWAKGT